MDLIKSLAHPSELWAVVQYKLGKGAAPPYVPENPANPTSRDRCYDYLLKTSRSFAAVIQALDGELRDAICLFYLILRGLDTVEDDMTIPLERKLFVLGHFHEYIYQRGWSFHENSEKEKDRDLVRNFGVVVDEFLKLQPGFQKVIERITKEMAAGMAEFQQRKVVTKKDYDLYCYYVAGLVGIGLSELFFESGLEDAVIAKKSQLSNSMGLFLQKTNIIRDFFEDLHDDRAFWPLDVVGKYVPRLQDLADPANKEKALACLNHLVTDALAHVPDCLEYMSLLKNQSVFNFCAIPQVMAIATLELVYNNYAVFYRKEVKIRKGMALELMINATSMENVREVFHRFSTKIAAKIPYTDPSCLQTSLAIGKIQRLCEKNVQKPIISDTDRFVLASLTALVGVIAYYAYVNFAQFASAT